MPDAQRLLDQADSVELLAALTAGTITSVELVNAQLDRMDIYNPSVNAVVVLDVDRALADAADCDAERAAGALRGPLHGLPMTVKDCYEVAGVVSAAGAPALSGHVPERDADLVAALRAAGAIIVGKTNVPMLGGDQQTNNEVYGLTRNPWHPDRTAGGSSGGAAAALACGFTTAEIGSDIGGSIRIPAHFNGVFGLKTTFGVLSTRGHLPPAPGSLAAGDLTVAGPLGRSVADLRLLMEALVSVGAFAGVPGASLPTSSSRPSDAGSPAAEENVAGLRVAVWADSEHAPVASAVRETIEGVGVALKNAGATVHTELRPDIDAGDLNDTYLDLLLPTIGAGFGQDLYDRLAQRAADDTTRVRERRQTASHRDWLAADERRAQAIASWGRLFDQVDVVIAPVTQTPAFEHCFDESYYRRTVAVDGVDRPYAEVLFWAGLATMPGLPVVTVPVGLIDGMPCGMQIIGPRWSDLVLLDQAESIGGVAGSGFVAPPLVTG